METSQQEKTLKATKEGSNLQGETHKGSRGFFNRNSASQKGMP